MIVHAYNHRIQRDEAGGYRTAWLHREFRSALAALKDKGGGAEQNLDSELDFGTGCVTLNTLVQSSSM